MDAETLTALKASIAHWRENERVLYRGEARLGASACALCSLFLTYGGKCHHCPIKQRTGTHLCGDTPYDGVLEANAEWEFAEDAQFEMMDSGQQLFPGDPHLFIHLWRVREAFLLAARDERLFLESLLP